VDNINILNKKRSNGRTVVTYRCGICLNTNSQREDAFSKSGCVSCNKLNKKPKQTHEEFLNKFKQADQENEYELLSVFQKAKTKINILHKKCGSEYSVSPYHFLNGTRCAKCQNINLTKEEAKQFYSKHLEGYDIIGEFKGVSKPVLLKHELCGNTFETKLNRFSSRGMRCPKCFPQGSKMEAIIEAILVKNYIKYEKEIKFDECRHKSKLRFDFKIFLSDDKWFLLEADGEQHFIQRDGFSFCNSENFKRDDIKNKFCQEKNITLLRIMFNEDICDKLSKFLLRELSPPSPREIDKFYGKKIKREIVSTIRSEFLKDDVTKDHLKSKYFISENMINFILKYRIYPFQDELIRETVLEKAYERKKWAAFRNEKTARQNQQPLI